MISNLLTALAALQYKVLLLSSDILSNIHTAWQTTAWEDFFPHLTIYKFVWSESSKLRNF